MNAVQKPAPAAAVDARNIHQRLHAVMQEVDYVQKDKKIDVGRGYKAVTHDAVTAKVRPVLVKHGVMYYPQNMRHEQNGNRTEVSLDVVFVNVNDPTDKVAVPTFGYGIDPGDKGPGKAVSYAIKYALLKALGLETGEDADNDGDVKRAPEEAPPKAERQLTKQQARPEYDRLLNELQAQPTVPDLEAWGKRNKPRLDAMPTDWQQSLKNEYADHKSNLMKVAAQ